MKKVINTPEEITTILLDNINDESIVGVQWSSNPGEKSWVIEINSDEYCGLRIGTKTLCYRWTSPSVKSYCAEALRMLAEVFVFDTEAELIEWLKK